MSRTDEQRHAHVGEICDEKPAGTITTDSGYPFSWPVLFLFLPSTAAAAPKNHRCRLNSCRVAKRHRPQDDDDSGLAGLCAQHT